MPYFLDRYILALVIGVLLGFGFQLPDRAAAGVHPVRGRAPGRGRHPRRR
ncbi:MAG: hypothetical protein MZV65_21335 [Chromatiales bacterium]|nr:hypothetical protein [Chromatiales bacterium]